MHDFLSLSNLALWQARLFINFLMMPCLWCYQQSTFITACDISFAVILRHFDQKVTSSSFHLIRQQRFNKEVIYSFSSKTTRHFFLLKGILILIEGNHRGLRKPYHGWARVDGEPQGEIVCLKIRKHNFKAILLIFLGLNASIDPGINCDHV